MNEEAVFTKAIDIESAEERALFLDEVCGDDAELRSSVEQLLRLHARSGEFLERPATEGREAELLESVVAGRHDPTESGPDQTQALDIPLDFLAPTDHPGSLGRLDQYEVLEAVGRGGMGIVLKARDTKLHRIVAVKVLAPELAANASARKRFAREAQAAAAVSHDHVVTIYAVEDGSQDHSTLNSQLSTLPYLVMEFIDGQSLQEKIDREGHLELKEILRIGRQVAAGLAAAHEQGLIHRDVKPSNILLQNGVQRVQITDFGLARAVDDIDMTKVGEVTGTPQYMSPEQAQGQPVDARSDLFSLGSVLYAMCTGHSPFRAETSVASLRRVCDDTPRPIRQINADIPEWLVAIIERLLEKNADDRFQTAEEIAELLGRHLAHLQDPGSTPFPGTLRPLQRRAPSHIGGRRHRWVVAGLVLFVVAASFGVTEATGLTQITTSVISIVRGDGMLVVEVDDPGVSVTIEGPDVVITGAGPQLVRLRPGQYEVRAARNGEPARSQLVTITRGDQRVVSISLEPNSTQETVGELLSFAEHSWHVWSVAFAPDGRHVLSAGGPDVFYWDVKSGAVVHRYAGHGDPNIDGAINVAFAPTGRSFFTSASNGSIREWDLETGELLRRLDDQRGFLKLSLSRDGSRLLASADDTATVWDVTAGEKLLRFTSHDHPIHSIALNSDGRRALTADRGGTVLYWNAETGEVRQRFENHCGNVTFHPDGRHALTGVMQSLVMLDLEAGREVRRFVGHDEPVTFAAISPDGSRVLSTSNDLTVRLWNTETGEQLARFEGHTDAPTSLAFSPDGRLAVSGSQRLDGTVRVWALPAPEKNRVSAPESGAFAVLGPQGFERRFDTLVEAVRGSSPGDTIEIRSNGPFVTDRVEIRHPLVIRAGDGYWPVIQSSAETAPPYNIGRLLRADDAVVLEGLEFRQVGQLPESFGSLIATTAPLRMSNCRVRSMTYTNCIRGAQHLMVRNSLLITEDAGACFLWWPFSTEASCDVDNCILVGGTHLAPPQSYENPGTASARFSRCTLLGPDPPTLAVILVSSDQRPPGEDRVWLDLDLRETIFDCPSWLTATNVGEQLADTFVTPGVEAQIPRWLPRSGSNNLYRAGVKIFQLRVGTADEPNRFAVESDEHLENWQQFLGHPEPESSVGVIRYSGGDLGKKAEFAPDDLTPEDFRLRTDSAGYQAGPNGRDLGADVDLVGPGEAYTRWKQTPAYAEWLEETARLMAGPVSVEDNVEAVPAVAPHPEPRATDN